METSSHLTIITRYGESDYILRVFELENRIVYCQKNYKCLF